MFKTQWGFCLYASMPMKFFQRTKIQIFFFKSGLRNLFIYLFIIIFLFCEVQENPILCHFFFWNDFIFNVFFFLLLFIIFFLFVFLQYFHRNFLILLFFFLVTHINVKSVRETELFCIQACLNNLFFWLFFFSGRFFLWFSS